MTDVSVALLYIGDAQGGAEDVRENFRHDLWTVCGGCTWAAD